MKPNRAARPDLLISMRHCFGDYHWFDHSICTIANAQ
jgi:hypothetical protein